MRKMLFGFLAILIGITMVTAACAPVSEPEPTQEVIEEPTAVPPTEETAPEPTEEPEPEPIVVMDDLGQEISLAEPAQKIISISPSLTEILFGVGAGDRLIGRDSNSTFPEEALSAVDLGGMWDGIPVEDILAMEPDLILAGEIFSAEAVGELRDLGLHVYWQANPDDFEGLYDNIRDISVLTGTEEEAETLIADLTSRVAEIDQKLADVEEFPVVFYELDASEPANPWTAGGDTFISYVINRAKGQNLGDTLEGDWVQISSEALVAENPDLIILADEIYGVTAESVAERAGWSEISAVQNGEIYGLDPFILSVPGPRLIDGYQTLAVIFHPEVME